MKKQDENLNRDGEYQRRCAMSEDERRLISRDLVAKDLYEQNVKEGKKTTYEDCQRKMAEIANKELRKEQNK